MFKLLSNRLVRLTAVTGCVLSIGIASTPSTAADARLQALFHWLDQDGDGHLSDSELIAGEERPASLTGAEVILTTKDGHMPTETPDDVFGRVDVNGDGRITLTELSARVGIDSRVGQTLLDADLDDSNSVTAAEIAARITEARAASGASRPAIGAALMAEGLMSAHDLNKDGLLAHDELAG